MHPFVSRVARFCKERDLLRCGDTVLVAVSGGPDSMALLRALLALRGTWNLRIAAAHFNHGIRGKASDLEARIVCSRMAALGIPCTVEKADFQEFRRCRKLSVQAAARELRYGFLERIGARVGADRIALGHTADDQAEELLLRLVRGVGPDGLRGMPARRGPFVRPLLERSREEIVRFLHEHHYEYLEDASNRSRTYLRNRIRLDVLPEIEKLTPRIRKHLLSLARLCEEDADYFRERVSEERRRLTRLQQDGLIALDRTGLAALPRSLGSRLVRSIVEEIKGDLLRVGRSHVDALLSAAGGDAPNVHLDFPGDVAVEIQYGAVVVRRRTVLTCVGALDLEKPGTYVLPGLRSTLELESREAGAGLSPWCAFLDPARVRFPLTLRSVAPGDRMRPVGGSGSRKVADLFTDRRIPRWLRPLVPLVCCGERIVWVAGVGADERFGAAPGPGPVLRIALRGWLAELVECGRSSRLS